MADQKNREENNIGIFNCAFASTLELDPETPKNNKDQGNICDNELDQGERETEEDDVNCGFLNFLESLFKEDSRAASSVKKIRPILDIGEKAKKVYPAIVFLLFLVFLIAVVIIPSEIEKNSYWCDGDGLIYILTFVTAIGLLYSKFIKKYFSKARCESFQPLTDAINKQWEKRAVRLFFYLGLIGGVVCFYVMDTVNQRRRLVSFVGFFFIVAFGFVFSRFPHKVVWRYVMWGLSLQFLMALCVLRWPMGNRVLQCLSGKVSDFLAFSTAGAVFVFGPLSENPSTIFAFTVLPVTIFFSFCTNILYYYGVVQWLVLKVGWFLQVTVGTSLCESMNAAGSIFLGLVEAPLLVKPYLSLMTKSELHAIMTAGFATIAGSVMAAYIALGADASLLLTASVMNAPAALAFSKLMFPDTVKTRIHSQTVRATQSTEVNALHAGCVGVTNAIPLVTNIAANLIAFIAFITFANSVFDWACQLVNIDEGTCSLEGVFGYIFMPFAWMMGVKWDDCFYVGQLLGLKISINEFVAYTKLSELIQSNLLSARSQAIATMALCGFGNFGSIGIMMGGLGPLAPNKKDDMAKIAFRAMITGSMATFSSACMAGTLIPDSDVYGFSDTEMTTIVSNITQGEV